MDDEVMRMFFDAMSLKLGENRAMLEKQAETDPELAKLLRRNSLPGRPDKKLQALPAAVAKKAMKK